MAEKQRVRPSVKENIFDSRIRKLHFWHLMHTAKGPIKGWKKSVANYGGDAVQKTNGYDADSEDTLQA